MRNKITRGLAMAALLGSLLALGGCDFSKTETAAAPTDPPAPTFPSNDSTVIERAGGVCSTTGPCVADYSVTLSSGESVSWVFTGADPTTSTIQAGAVQWGGAGSYRWTSKVCNADLCKDAGGVVNFSEP